jgi:hypothetical protein
MTKGDQCQGTTPASQRPFLPDLTIDSQHPSLFPPILNPLDDPSTTRRPPTVQIKRNAPPKLNASIPEVEPGSVTAVDVPDYMNVTFTGDLSIALIREERHTYDRRHTAIATLYERTLPELNRKGNLLTTPHPSLPNSQRTNSLTKHPSLPTCSPPHLRLTTTSNHTSYSL